MKYYLTLWLSLLAFSVSADTCTWPEWNAFKSRYINQGQVINRANEQYVSSIEGQAYGLFFALIANDELTFERLLIWTQDHLGAGDLTARLALGLWPSTPAKKLSVDVKLLAYTLSEAGQKWNNAYYSNLGYFLATRIEKEQHKAADKGLSLLRSGRFMLAKENRFTLNPSYQWASMLNRQHPQFKALKQQLQPFIDVINEQGFPHKKVRGTGVQASNNDSQSDKLQQRFVSTLANEHTHLYDTLLVLFTSAWYEQRFHFDSQGSVTLAWETPCLSK